MQQRNQVNTTYVYFPFSMIMSWAHIYSERILTSVFCGVYQAYISVRTPNLRYHYVCTLNDIFLVKFENNYIKNQIYNYRKIGFNEPLPFSRLGKTFKFVKKTSNKP